MKPVTAGGRAPQNLPRVKILRDKEMNAARFEATCAMLLLQIHFTFKNKRPRRPITGIIFA